MLGAELSREQQNEIKGVLSERENIFTDKPGKTSITEHRVHLVDDCPSQRRSYALSYAVRGEIYEEIKEMNNTGIVCKPDLSPMVVVKKKDGSNCICVDYRKLNRITVTDPELLTTAKDLFQKFRQCQFFSKIDFSESYWQIPMPVEDVYKINFMTGNGYFEFLRKPFGIKTPEQHWFAE